MEIKECQSFSQWVINARPNDKYIYFKGFSLTDTFIGLELQKISWAMAVKGSIYLVQQKLQPHNYQFIAIKASSPPIYKLVPLQHEKLRERKIKWVIAPGKVEHLEISGLN